MQNWRTIATDVPAQALSLMAEQLTEFGAEVEFQEPGRGKVRSISGVLAFRLDAGRFDVKFEKDRGHFPEKMLIGGMRQFVEEAVERCKRVEA
jgi:hypothetical protein